MKLHANAELSLKARGCWSSGFERRLVADDGRRGGRRQ